MLSRNQGGATLLILLAKDPACVQTWIDVDECFGKGVREMELEKGRSFTLLSHPFLN